MFGFHPIESGDERTDRERVAKRVAVEEAKLAFEFQPSVLDRNLAGQQLEVTELVLRLEVVAELDDTRPFRARARRRCACRFPETAASRTRRARS